MKGRKLEEELRIDTDFELSAYTRIRELKDQFKYPNMTDLCMEHSKAIFKFQDLGYNYLDVNKMVILSVKQYLMEYSGIKCKDNYSKLEMVNI